jgi:hypothetical protein
MNQENINHLTISTSKEIKAVIVYKKRKVQDWMDSLRILPNL